MNKETILDNVNPYDSVNNNNDFNFQMPSISSIYVEENQNNFLGAQPSKRSSKNLSSYSEYGDNGLSFKALRNSGKNC